jgi:hypothetical protein
MDNNSRLELITGDVDSLVALIRKIQESPQQVPLIEVDLALEKLRRIYEQLVQMDVQSTVITTQIKEKATVQKEIGQDEPVKEAPVEFNHKKDDVIDSSPVEETDEKGKRSAKEIKGKEPPQALIDLFSTSGAPQKVNDTKSVVDKMTEQKPPEIIADKFGKKKIAGLSQAIGINEKFFFINELFEGNMKDYKSAIDALDQSESLENALENIETLTKKHGWDKSMEAYTMLIDFVERRFS